MPDSMEVPTIRFVKGTVEMIDQTRLPGEYIMLSLLTVDAICEAIKKLAIRGAPALGVAGAFGLLLAIEDEWRQKNGFYFDWDLVDTSSFPQEAAPSDIIAVVDAAAMNSFGPCTGKRLTSTWKISKCAGGWGPTAPSC